ncbi:MAG TPA: M48 family metallopeptidase [Elusimicrobiales bacterium]|nr:M48 family metallopeptidase [Elusimicrobiales bacterium]
MSVEDVCRDVRLFLKGLTRELPGIFPAPRFRRRRAPRRAYRTRPGTPAEQKLAKEIITASVARWAAALDLEYNRVSIKDQRTVWGSCSVKKNLNFYWRLAAAPVEILDYLVIHELCHLREMNHSKRFWDLVRRACPDYPARRKWLRDNCAELRDPEGKYSFFTGTAAPGETAAPGLY